MDEIPTFEEAERRFLELIAENQIPEPDGVERRYREREIVFLWNDTKTAVVVELDG